MSNTKAKLTGHTIIVIYGPELSGKTSLAKDIAKCRKNPHFINGNKECFKDRFLLQALTESHDLLVIDNVSDHFIFSRWMRQFARENLVVNCKHAAAKTIATPDIIIVVNDMLYKENIKQLESYILRITRFKETISTPITTAPASLQHERVDVFNLLNTSN